ncbi:Hint domain-containing protein [Roseisalinus antarcticus]|uniref:Hedgehog/Intein (Hint) domain-containing protein n=1 Tax=Roseisalinus antarcticus TaxID=254357 RepID=A0A1Y5SDF9_9RHOB|nr:Hint domain-containing protein [Roseisalinus antarcticus]SLN38166.1 hypothetical protein ROA7023_01462 [Roseisalinus antarcticus]
MAFVSEIHYRTSVADGAGVPDYVEVTVSAAEMSRLADFRVATYQADGSLAQIVELSSVTSVEDPATGFHVFEVPVRVTEADFGGSTNEAEAVALVDGGARAPVLSFHDIGVGTSGTTALDGPAAGATSVKIPPASGDTIQFDAYGNRLDGPMTRDSSVICLTEGTLIETPGGERPIETLWIGDLVRTVDNGDQPIRMIHARRLFGTAFRRARHLWPVRIGKGAMEFGLPRRDLWVSPQHRMLFSHIRIGLMFEEDAVLVRAKSLAASMDRVHVDSALAEVTYYHLVFDRHELIRAEGAATESFHPGEEGLASLDGAALAELYEIFPDLRRGVARPEADYMTLRSWELMAAVA